MVKKTLLVAVAILFAVSLYAQPPHGGKRWGPIGQGAVRPMRPLPPEVEKKLLNEVGKVSPYLVGKLKKLKEENPMLYRGILIKTEVGYRWWQRLKKDHEGKKFADELWKLSIKERELAVKYHDATSDKERSKIRKLLEKIDYNLFDLRQKARKITIKKLEEKLKQIKEDLKDREEHKEEIIKQHIDQITGQGRRWRW